MVAACQALGFPSFVDSRTHTGVARTVGSFSLTVGNMANLLLAHCHREGC